VLTSREAAFWRSLGGTEKDLLARLGRRTCFVCLLRDALERQERFEGGLYRAMMSLLLVPPAGDGH